MPQTRVLFIWDGDYPWDVPVEKVCGSLIRNGYQVHLVCRNQKRRARHELLGDLHIHRTSALPAWMGSANSAYTFPAFFSPIWRRHIREVSKRHGPFDVVVVRDLPMAATAIWIAQHLRIPVALDMAECYPEMLRAAWQFEKFRPQNVLVRNPQLADRLERWVMSRLDQVWVMVQESRDRLIAMGVAPERIRIVSNTPYPAAFKPLDRSNAAADNKLRLIYAGLLNPSRGLDVAIRAVALLASKGVPIELTVIGTGKAEADLHALARTLKCEESVIFRGWIDSKHIPAEVARADAGIVPHRRCSHWDNTIPNKLFDYMAAGLPVLVSDARPTARIVSKTECGLVYENSSAESMAEQIARLRDPALRGHLAQNGRTAVEREYRWDNDERVMLEGMALLRPAAASA